MGKIFIHPSSFYHLSCAQGHGGAFKFSSLGLCHHYLSILNADDGQIHLWMKPSVYSVYFQLITVRNLSHLKIIYQQVTEF